MGPGLRGGHASFEEPTRDPDVWPNPPPRDPAVWDPPTQVSVTEGMFALDWRGGGRGVAAFLIDIPSPKVRLVS